MSVENNNKPRSREAVQKDVSKHLDREWVEMTKQALLAGAEITPKKWIRKKFKAWQTHVLKHREFMRKGGMPIDWRQFELERFLEIALIHRLFEGTPFDCGGVSGRFSLKTKEQVQKFQDYWNKTHPKNLIEANGKITRETLRCMAKYKPTKNTKILEKKVPQ